MIKNFFNKNLIIYIFHIYHKFNILSQNYILDIEIYLYILEFGFFKINKIINIKNTKQT